MVFVRLTAVLPLALGIVIHRCMVRGGVVIISDVLVGGSFKRL